MVKLYDMCVRHLEFTHAAFDESDPVLEEVFTGSDTETNHSERICNLPIPRLGRHVSRFGIDDLDRLRPLRVIDFCLGRLKVGENSLNGS